jgi:O-antigen/teichoic acid export membrane protein
MPNDSARPLSLFRLGKGVLLYALARCAGGVVRILTVPFIVHAVSPTEFGTLATLWIPLFIVHGVCDLGLGTAALRFAPECATPAERRELFATMVAGRAAAGSVLSALIIAAHEPLARWVTGTSGNGEALALLAVLRPVAMMFDAFLDELRSREAFPAVSALTLFATILMQGFSVLFTVGLGRGLVGLVWARVLGEALAFAVAAVLCSRFVLSRPSRRVLRQLFLFGWPLGMVFALATLRGLDRPLIRVLASVEDVAAYELAMRLIGPVGVTNIALALVLEPFIYGHSQSRDTPAMVDVFVRGYVVVFGTLSMALSLLGPEMVRLFAPEAYHGAIRALPPLVFAAAYEGLQRASVIGADLEKRTGVWAGSSLITLGIGFSLATLMVPKVGIAGAGFAWVVATVCATMVVYRVAVNVSGIRLPVGRAVSFLAAGAVFGTAAAWQPWPVPARLALFVAYVLAARSVMGTWWKELPPLART